jgi:hypothetical protein
MASRSALKDCEMIPVEDVITPPEKGGTYDLYVSRYWQVVDGCVLLYKGFSPQCNASESLSRRLAGGVGEVVFLERVWLKHKCDV